MRSSLLIDGSRWDGSDPYGYARSFSLHALDAGAPARVGR
jgi:nitrate/nitrite transport system substrate-binding protein